ncbi:hypothetical protein N9N67_07935, partial [Bacteriovoracaceae bacterium]|nr:hypothetical protein [Bacteriovoracaceae bacterium]
FNSKTTFSKSYNKVYVKNWGARGDRITIGPIKKSQSGRYVFQLSYSNLGHINTGITAVVKRIELRDYQTNRLIRKGIIQMPQNDQERYWIDSNFFELPLDKRGQYKIIISDHFNMSYFSHFENYLDRGGKSGYDNRVHLSEFKLLKL